MFSLDSICIYCSRHACLGSTLSTDIFYTRVFAFAHATWHSYVLVRLYPDNSKSASPDLRVWTLVKIMLLIGVHSGSVASHRIETWQRLGSISDGPPDSSSLSDFLEIPPSCSRDLLLLACVNLL